VDHGDRGVDLGALAQRVAAQLERAAAHHASDAGNDGTDAQYLLGDGVNVRVVALGHRTL
jgi:hypothetical protein